MTADRLLRLTLAAAALAACHPAGPAPSTRPALGSFVIRGARVFDGERVLPRATVVVRAGRIVEVGAEADAAGLPVIDAAGATVLPGLIDAHAHVRTDAGLRDALRFGVTTELDMMTEVAFAQAHRAARDALAPTELADLYSAGTPVTSDGGMGTQFGLAIPTLAGARDADAFVAARLAEGSAFIKVMYEPDAGIVSSLDASTLAAVVAAAHARGARVAVHVSSQAGARDAVAAGADCLAHVFSDRAIDDALVAAMVAQRTCAISTLSIMAAFAGASPGPALARDPRIAPFLSADQRAALAEPGPGKDDPMAPYLARFQLPTALANVRRLSAAGVQILAGDDAATLGVHGATLHGELALLVRAGLSPTAALRAATSAPAARFGLADRGRIAAGARADLVIVDGDPTTDIEATRAIRAVAKNGYWVQRAPR